MSYYPEVDAHFRAEFARAAARLGTAFEHMTKEMNALLASVFADFLAPAVVARKERIRRMHIDYHRRTRARRRRR